MYQAHIEMHSGSKYTLATSQIFCQIIAGKQLAYQVVKGCPPCRIERAKRVTLVMCDVAEDRIKPSEPFTDVQVDLCGPISILDPRAKTRRSIPDKPTWILLAVCRDTGIGHLTENQVWLDFEREDATILILV